jgi:hypothetical protein
MGAEPGCKACFQGDAEKVWNARQFDSLARLVDDSHFSITIMACAWCGQRCVKTFTEFVDWSGGDDSQYWYLIPITADEADQLVAQGEKVDTKQIDAMSAGRRVLQADFPTGKEKRIHWANGPILIVPGH